MTDSSMNFGPAWIRNLRSEGTTANAGGGTGGGSRYQLADYRYGREEMLALYDKVSKPPSSLLTFKTLYSEQPLLPLALLPNTEEEQRGWQSRPTTIAGAPRGRGGSLERGGRVSRGRGGYQSYGRATSAFDSGWGNGEQPDWSPRKEFASRSINDNWRRVRPTSEDDDGWRNISSGRAVHEKWGRSQSWRGDTEEERNGPPERGGRPSWHDGRGGPLRRSWDNEDHLPEWATENPTEGGGTFDERGAFHGSDDEPDPRKESKKDLLHKSTSQQHIPSKANQVGLSSSKSTSSLVKSEENDKYLEEVNCRDPKEEMSRSKERCSPENDRNRMNSLDKRLEERLDKSLEEAAKVPPLEKSLTSNGPPKEMTTQNIDKADEDFDRLQEDLVLKLVVDEETPKSSQPNFDVGGVQPPPNLVPPSQEKWYYQDPQGTRQGPFTNVEMAEWYKAGYFSNQLNVMRECDERYFLLGELINMCGGENPFLTNIRFPLLKNEPAKLPDDMLPYQFLSQLAYKQQVSLRNLAEPWSALTLQQQELAAQRLLLQQQQQQPPQQMPSDLQFMQQSPPSNPLMYMINQMQQSNKLPGSVLVDKPSNSVPNQLDPLLVQMGNIHPLQNRMQTPGLHNHLPGGVPANLTSSLPPDGLGSTLPGLQTPPISTGGGISSLPGIHGNIPTGLPGPVNLNRPTSHSSIDQLQSGPQDNNDPITNFLKQFQQQRQVNTLWEKQNQFNVPPPASTPSQWPQQPEPSPISMWDLQAQAAETAPPVPSDDKEQRPKEREETTSQKEVKRRKEIEEKQAKKEAEERRKQEQKKQEAEKKAAEDKKKKEEEKIRKELEKAKKEAEEKRLRELEEKRRLKEQRKAEEEARKKTEEVKKLEEEKNRREVKEKEDRKQQHADAVRLAQVQAARSAAKTAPWSQQSNFAPGGLNLTDIQKAEKERRAQESALQMQKQQLHEQQQQQQQQMEKAGGLQLNWAKKPLEPRKVKSFAEIQAEEQERMAKLSAEAKLAAQLKEKEAPVANSGNIWNGQSLTWANASSTSQWSSNSNTGGFWDEVPAKSSNKPSTVSKSNSTSAMTTAKQVSQQKQPKSKPKKEESPKAVNNNNNQTKDEFNDWCYKTLSNISADVDIPTFVTFLRDVESAYDVRDYCKEYLGESPATQQFASNFLEKRRSYKPKNHAHKDDMCSPAPAITPSTQHSTEFQEVKGKNKKNKKSKMLKVDSRILGFNVTSAPDRINVGDRDYGDNS